MLRARMAGHKCFGIQIVSVHQAGIQHTGEKHDFFRQAVCQVCAGKQRRGNFFFPMVVRFEFALLGPPYSSEERGGIGAVGHAAAVRQSSMMPGDGKR
ncbi:hypothetical protein AGATL06_08040 [Agathobaculum sp. TL06]